MRDEEAKRADTQFFSRFGIVLALMLAFTVCCALIARAVSPSSTDLRETVNSPEAIAERIAPEGKIHLEGAELPSDAMFARAVSAANATNAAVSAVTATTSSDASASPAADDGESVYVQACQLCHSIGLAGAPKPQDAEVWQTRLEQGLDTLYLNAINGIRGMPARGGRPDLSDSQVRAAVDFMLPAR